MRIKVTPAILPPFIKASSARRLAALITLSWLQATLLWAETEPSGVSEGPWGRIVYHHVLIEPPATHLWDSLYDERSIWNFGNLTQNQILDTLHSIGVRPVITDLLLTQGKWNWDREGHAVEFPDVVVETLNAKERLALSHWFRVHSTTFFSRLLINLEGGDVKLFEGRLKPETIASISRVIYQRGSATSLMDRAYILRQIGDDEEEKKKFIRNILSTKALIVLLEIDPQYDRDKVKAYWSAGGRNPNAALILDSALLRPELGHLDVTHLFPVLPRRYTGNFVYLRDLSPKNPPDCFWTSLHFFRSRASLRMLDQRPHQFYITDNFEEVDDEPMYGDMICLFRRNDDSFLHSYTHITDDIVLTKNGSSFSRPVVMTLKSSMMSIYEEGDPFYAKRYRTKVLP